MYKTYLKTGKKIDEYHVLDSRFLTIDGKRYEIVDTTIYGRGVMDVRHVIRGSMEKKTVEHRTLVKLFNEDRLN
jgi:hypothetical protein